jgi:hypothetical protein
MDIEALRVEWVGRRVFLPSVDSYAFLFDITSRGEVGIRLSSDRSDGFWEFWTGLRALGVEIVLISREEFVGL